MVFSSIIFLFIFFPIVLLVYFLLPNIKCKNIFLLLASLFFYTWGELRYVVVMIFSITVTWYFGKKVATSERKELKKRYLILGIAVNLSLLLYFKYANFIVDNFIIAFQYIGAVDKQKAINFHKVHLPIGVSFFTFQAISYIIDVYRNNSIYQKNLIIIGMYKSFFPQLIAGPIVRYVDIKEQTHARNFEFDVFFSGVERFILGLAQKVLIANTMGSLADKVFNNNSDLFSWGAIWLGVFAYTLQIYYDFSGYSSMAIGLGRMFGFKFLENFNFPYSASSITDFWRRWHISLSTWFRDYLYIPLGGNKCSKVRNYANLLIVFLLCGFWHGASWTFVFWGFFHGCFLIIEKLFLLSFLQTIPKLFCKAYTLLVVMVGWVFFRCDNFAAAVKLLKRMFGMEIINNTNVFMIQDIFSLERKVYMTVGIIFAIFAVNLKYIANLIVNNKMQVGTEWLKSIVVIGMFLLSILYLSGSTFNPFIYFRF